LIAKFTVAAQTRVGKWAEPHIGTYVPPVGRPYCRLWAGQDARFFPMTLCEPHLYFNVRRMTSVCPCRNQSCLRLTNQAPPTQRPAGPDSLLRTREAAVPCILWILPDRCYVLDVKTIRSERRIGESVGRYHGALPALGISGLPFPRDSCRSRPCHQGGRESHNNH
jgi:hypothetical protein